MSKDDPARLDPRRSRKLTSRECASVIGGYLGGMATSNLIGVEVARRALGLFVADAHSMIWESIRHQADKGSGETAESINDAYDVATKMQADGANEAHRVFWRGLGATVSGLRVLASEKAVKTALNWLYEQDDFWPKEKGG